MSSRPPKKPTPTSKPEPKQEETPAPTYQEEPKGAEAWTSASKSPPSAEATPTAQPETQTEAEQHGITDDELRKISADIKRQIHGISAQCKTVLRSVIDRYPRCVSRQLATDDDSNFPRTVRRHIRDHDRSTADGFGDLLCFHIGNTILAFYDAVNGEDHEHLRARLQHLREINEHGPGNFHPYGSVQHGWMLMHVNVVRKKQAEDEAERERIEERRARRGV